MMINKSWCKIAVWFSHIFEAFFWNSIRFPWFNPSRVSKIFNIFLAGINTKSFWKILKEKYFAPLRILNFFINSFVNFLLILLQLFLSISLWLAKFVRFHLKSKFSAANLLNSKVVIYLSWLWSIVFFSILLTFVL